MRKTQPGEPREPVNAGPVLNKAASNPAYFQSLQQNPQQLATELGVSPALGYLIELLGAEICVLQGGDVVQCITANWH